MTKFNYALFCTAATIALGWTSANAETRDFDFDGFSKVGASAGVSVQITTGADYSIRAEGSDTGLDDLKITKKGDSLNVGRNKTKFFKRRSDISVYITMPALEGVRASSGSEVEATGIDADKFSVSVSSGADVSINGRCDDISASVSSGSDLDGRNLRCRNASVTASSGADASVYASEKVVASASSGGDVDVYGGPEIREINKSSGGDVSIRN
jgi:putative autotransporter adhesin-like protein